MLVIILVIFAFIKTFFFSFFGLNFFDYGETMHNSQRILGGGLLYQDIWAIFPPLDNYFPAIFVKLLGDNLLSVRLVESLLFTLLIYILIKISKLVLNNFYTSLVVLCVIFSDLNTYLLFYQVFFFAAFYLCLKYFQNKKDFYLFLSGILVAIGGLIRHDTAIFAASAIGITLLYKKKFIGFRNFLLGGLTIVVPVVFWLIRNNIFDNFWHLAFIRAPQISKVVSPGFELPSNLLTPSALLQLATLGFYCLYILIFIAFGVKVVKQKKLPENTILLISLFALFQITYAFSVIEIGHLVKAGIPALILGGYLIKNAKFKLFPNLCLFAFLVVGIASSVWWIAYNDTRIDTGKGIVFVNSKFEKISTHPTASTLLKTIEFVKQNSANQDYIFAAPYHAMIYYLTDRKSPSRYNNFLAGFLPKAEQSEVIQSIKSHNVNIVVYDPVNGSLGKNLEVYSPELHEFIINNYQTVDTTEQGWLLMKRKLNE